MFSLVYYNSFCCRIYMFWSLDAFRQFFGSVFFSFSGFGFRVFSVVVFFGHNNGSRSCGCFFGIQTNARSTNQITLNFQTKNRYASVLLYSNNFYPWALLFLAKFTGRWCCACVRDIFLFDKIGRENWQQP